MARHYAMGMQSMRELRVPDLMGGLNTRDSLSMVNDNQLTDCLNVWWNNGSLRTRPGLGKQYEKIDVIGYIDELNAKQTGVYVGGYKLCYCEIVGQRKVDDRTETFAETSFWLQGLTNTFQLETLNYGGVGFVCQKGKTVYVFLKSQKIYKNDFYFEGDTLRQSQWTEVSNDSEHGIYVPTVYTNCLVEANEYFSGVMVDGYNIIGDYFKIVYSTVNKNFPPIDNLNRYEMSYTFPKREIKSPWAYEGKTITATITDELGVTTSHTVTLKNVSGDISGEETALQGDGLRMRANLNGIEFLHSPIGSIDEYSHITIDDKYIENNLEITVPYISTEEEKRKVFDMSRCEWFGGDAAGISGGTRLFLCGNTNENEKALVVWSGLNNPLYFSENGYAYVGNENQAVTCFGKQGETLVMFKESGAGTYYTQYVKADPVAASDLINQSIVDYSASSVYFPIVTLHPTIGCDCPDSVQLCRNRLVWTCSDGNVYTLASQSQYNERNIFSVSEMIAYKLKKETNLKNAVSADWQGHYLLFTNKSVYVMDYESYGYTYISSHAKTENAQAKIPWWYWEFSKKVETVISLNDSLFVVFYNKAGYLGGLTINEFDTKLKTDFGSPIETMLQTKLFDFATPSRNKNVYTVNLSLGNNGGIPIKVEIVTEHGVEEQEILLDDSETEIKHAGYICNKAVYPCIRAVKRFGVKLSCDGEIVIDGVSFNYTILGGVR